jgi:hypothetical protein
MRLIIVAPPDRRRKRLCFTSNHGRYVVKSLVHASRVIEAFQSAGDVLRLRDVVIRTGYSKGMCFWLLYTLHQCGFLDKVGENHYRLASEVPGPYSR